MRVAKIHDRLYRVYNGYSKDVQVKGGKIIELENVFNQLTDLERIAVENYLNKN